MKKNRIKRFNKYCGVGKIKVEENEGEVYVVYSSMDGFLTLDMGCIVGKGNSESEAMIDAIKTFTKMIRNFENFLETESNRKRKDWYHKDYLDKNPILPIEYEDGIKCNPCLVRSETGEIFVSVV